MINADMREYDVFTLEENNEYGQQTVSKQPYKRVKMAIYSTTQSIQDNINYANCEYIGLTTANVKDTDVIEYEGHRLKVLYINQKGRFKQAFLAKQ